MKNENMQRILDKIKEYDKILIFRHFRPDGDAIGSTKGLCAILRATFPEKRILLQNSDFSEYLSFLSGEDALLPDEEYADALALVLDTGTAKRVSNQKFKLCREVVKLDLRDKDIINSPYYYLQQNDVINVTPSDRKINTRSEEMQTLGFAMSGVGLVAAIVALCAI